MAHQETPEAVDVPVEHTVDSAAADILKAMSPPEEEEQPAEAAEDAPTEEIDPADLEALEAADDAEQEQTDEDDEQEAEQPPAIDTPVSLNAEEKAAYAQLPKEAQQFVTQLENRRATQVQEATTKASEAQRTAEAAAASADATAQRQYAEQLAQFTQAYEPVAPQAEQYGDMGSFRAAQAQYDHAKAQHDQIVQQITGLNEQATQQERETFQRQRDAELMQIPEIANAETRKDYIDKAMGMARELGYEESDIAEGMNARDMKALAEVASWKASHQQLTELRNKSKMQRVRAAKNKTTKPGAAQPTGSGNKAFKQAQAKAIQTGSVDDAANAIMAAFG